MSAVPTFNTASPDARERCAERLHEAISAAHDPDADFPEQVRSAIAAALALLAADPALTRLLTVEPCPGDKAAIGCHQRWKKRYGALLRNAAADSPQALTHPQFLEPILIDCIRARISRSVLAGEAAELEALLPDLLEFVLTYYLDPKQTASHVRVVRAMPQ